MNDPLFKFTERAKMVLVCVQDEAIRLHHSHVGTEHVLLGLVREGEGVAAQVLNNLGVELTLARHAVEFVVGRGERTVGGDIPLTPRAKRVIEFAIQEAARLGHGNIDTEHLLLGLVREGEGMAAGLLESLGVSLDDVPAQIEQVMHQSPVPRDPGRSQPCDVERPAPDPADRAADRRFPPPMTIVRQWKPRTPPADDAGAAAGDVR